MDKKERRKAEKIMAIEKWLREQAGALDMTKPEDRMLLAELMYKNKYDR